MFPWEWPWANHTSFKVVFPCRNCRQCPLLRRRSGRRHYRKQIQQLPSKELFSPQGSQASKLIDRQEEEGHSGEMATSPAGERLPVANRIRCSISFQNHSRKAPYALLTQPIGIHANYMQTHIILCWIPGCGPWDNPSEKPVFFKRKTETESHSGKFNTS